MVYTLSHILNKSTFLVPAAIKVDFSRVLPWWKVFLEGTGNTLLLSLCTVVFGLLLALLLVLMRRSKLKVLSFISNAYVLVVRGTPILVQLFIWMYGLPLIGIRFPDVPALGPVFGSREFITALVALSLNSAAYVAELLRGGLDAVSPGQSEAARSLGLSQSQTMRHIVIPQAIPIILPGLGNEFIQMIKETSIVSTVGIFDLMYSQNIVQASTYSIFEPLIVISLIYLFLTSVLTHFMKKLERKFHVVNKDTELA
jgi:His/Glu/Gln/Arg/opine family amino acid ABC transporter permease subunit